MVSRSGQPGGGWTNNSIGGYVSRVDNLADKKIGPNSLLKVMAGDEVSATSIYYYQDPVSNVSGTSHVSDVLTSLAQAISGGAATTGLTHGSSAATAITGQLNGYLPFTSVVSPDANSTAGNNPKAYLTVLFFDERFNFIPESSTNQRVTQAGNDALPLVLASIKAPKNGYAYVYVSNESDEMVYFDNVQVTHVRKHIIEENHYYAYGLRIAGISSKKLSLAEDGHIKNGYLYNDKELFEDADLDWYDYGFRMYDPQIARFTQLDPMTDSYPYYTPYQFAGCEPIGNIDLDGLEPLNVRTAAAAIREAGGTGVLPHFINTGINAGRWSLTWFQNGVSMSKVFTSTSRALDAVRAAAALLGTATSSSVSLMGRGDLASNFRISGDVEKQAQLRDYAEAMENLNRKIEFGWEQADPTLYENRAVNFEVNNITGETRYASTSITPVYPETIFIPLPKIRFAIAFIAKLGRSAIGAIGKGAAKAFVMIEATAAKTGQTVIGEGMKRVSMEAAKREGSVILNNMPKFTGTADQVTSQMMTYNRQWLLQQMRSGRPIIDIGLDPTRGAPSIFYQMEQNMIKNYLKLHPNAFQVIKP